MARVSVRSRVAWTAVVWLGLLLIRPVPVAAAEAGGRAYALTAWTVETGTSPGDVFAITQDRDGYLWLGTPNGLVRFDGFRFVPWVGDGGVQVPGPVLALAAARDGSVWVGAAGAIYQLRGSALRQYTDRDGFPGGVAALLEDRNGRIWAGNRRGVFRFADGRWSSLQATEGYSGAEVFSLREDHSGRVWIGSAEGVYRWAQGAFELMDGQFTNVQAFAEDTTGEIWISDPADAIRHLDRRKRVTYGRGVRLPTTGWRLLHDRHGQIWVAALGGGLLRVDQPTDAGAAVHRIEYEQRAAGATRALYEDREGNIWVGLRGGLLRMSEAAFQPGPALEGSNQDGVRTSAVSADGAVWIATAHSVTRFGPDGHTVYPAPQTFALYQDGPDGMMASTIKGLYRLQAGRAAPVPVTTGPNFNWGRVLALSRNDEGLWLCSALTGAMVWDGRRLRTFDDVPALAGRVCQVVLRDRRGRMWVGFVGGGGALYDHGTVQPLGDTEGLTRGAVVSIIEDRAGAVWVATAQGLNRYQNGRFTAVTPANIPFTEIVPSLVEDDEGYLWVGVKAGAGIIRFHPRELDKLAVDPSAALEYETYDSSDGIPQGTLGWQSGVTAVRGGDGRMWFAAGRGVVTIDPRTRPRMQRARTPVVEGVTADGRTLLPSRDLQLPSRTSTVRIQYGAVTLSGASKLRFRYMLEGVSDTWVSAGSAREAVFTDLPSGDYRFRVSATYDGEWADASTWEFAVAPPFYLTRWFLVLSAVALAMVLVAAWWLRLRSVRNQYALVFAERARMGREIHDTLLQSLAAIGYELETIAAQVDPSQDRLLNSVKLLRRQVGHSLREARESILDLRRTPMKSRGLVQSLKDLAEHMTRTGLRTELSIDGPLGSVSDEVDVQLFRIAQEAVGNARRHGSPTRVQMRLARADDALVLTVRDDGKGFDPDQYGTAPDQGRHLGLQSMRERAERVQGRLVIHSEPGHGTSIEATVPLSAA